MTSWRWEDCPDLTGKTIVVTGANSGIGFHATRHFSKNGARVIMACRSKDKAEAAQTEILSEFPDANVQVILVNLASQKSIREFKGKYEKETNGTPIDILLNNAGVMIPPFTETEDGFELQFGTNHLGHFALTSSLLPLLQAADSPRIVNVASSAHRYGTINWDDINWKNNYSRFSSYAQSKVANILFTHELAKRLEASSDPSLNKITVVGCHPGYTDTNLQYSGLSNPIAKALFWVSNQLFSQRTEMGAAPSVYAATDPEAVNDKYYGPEGMREMRGWPKSDAYKTPYSNDDEVSERLWTVSEELLGLKFFA